MPHRVVDFGHPCAQVLFLPGTIRFVTLRHGQRPFPAVVAHAGQRALEVHVLDVAGDDAPAEDIAVQVVNRQVVEKRQVFQPPDDDVIVVFVQYGFLHALQHTDAPLCRGQVPPALPFLVHGIAPAGHDHQWFRDVVHASGHFFVRIKRHTERVGRGVDVEYPHPTGVVAAATLG